MYAYTSEIITVQLLKHIVWWKRANAELSWFRCNRV